MSAAKRGRPRLSPELAKRHPLNMKTTKRIRSQLEEAAELSNRTLSQEVEHRLSESFLPMEILFGSDDTQALLRAIAGVVQVVENATKKPWTEDSDTADLAYRAITRILPNAEGKAVTSDASVAKAVIVEMLDRAELEENTRKKVEKLIVEG
ncbi:MAG: hypothetical protein VCD50_18845 [Alphaproteobacteria bacterium]